MIGFIFGETEFPKKILERAKKRKRFLIIDLTKKKIYQKNKNSYSASIGQFGKIISILKKNKCKKILFAGKVSRPSFSKLKLDLKGVYYIPRIIKKSKIGDAAILKEVIKIFEEEKIKTVNSLIFTPNLSLKKGVYTRRTPNYLDRKDINTAIKTLNRTNRYNYTQGVVVRDNKVIAIEGKNGTKKMLEKCRNKKIKNNGVLVKFPKKKQDIRIDLPTIGLNTIIQCKAAGLKGIVLKNKRNVFLDQKKTIMFANKNKMFIAVK